MPIRPELVVFIAASAVASTTPMAGTGKDFNTSAATELTVPQAAMMNFTFLTKEQIFGTDKLEIFKKYGTKCITTDFAVFLGGCVMSEYYTEERTFRKDY